MRKAIWTGVVVLLIAGVAAAAWAGTRTWMDHGWGRQGLGGHGWGNRWCGRSFSGPLGFAARELNLNDAQKKQIEGLWQAERPQVAALAKELAAESGEMRAANGSGVDEIAARQGATVAKLIVEKERLRSEIYAQVLTPDQRAKADRMGEQWQSHLERFADKLQDTTNNTTRDK